jgi:hypothetical protein
MDLTLAALAVPVAAVHTFQVRAALEQQIKVLRAGVKAGMSLLPTDTVAAEVLHKQAQTGRGPVAVKVVTEFRHP